LEYWGGGGGSGGSGENNTGNEHNNMAAAALQWQDDSLAAAVTQEIEITLAGETTTAPLTPAVTIQVPVNLDSLLQYTGAYNQVLKEDKLTTTYPSVVVSFADLKTAAAEIDLEWLTENSPDLLTTPGNTTVSSLQGHFNNDSWVYASPIFGDALPIESVVKVEKKAIFCDSLSTILDRATQLSSSTAGEYAVDLFEQMLAAGKFPKAQLDDGGNATLASNGSGNGVFSPGDSFSVYVTYTLTKTRKFSLDAVSGTGSAQIIFNGKTLTVTESEDAASIAYIVEWRFNHQA
jgi:hypothetical protein